LKIQDRRCRDHDGIRHQERSGLPPGERGHPGAGSDLLARELVCKGDRTANDAFVIDLAGPDVHREKLLDREVGETSGVLGDQGDGLVRRVADELFGRVFAVDEDGAPRRSVVTGEDLNIVDEGALSRTGGADDRYRVARADDDRVEPFRFRPGRTLISRTAEGSMLEGRHAGR
jgi:hypothetical protein